MLSQVPFSLIIPALNEAPLISQAVERAWQTHAREVIVADGGSQDGTAQLARDAGAVVLVSDAGRARQQNLGARHATCEILLFLHADTWLDPAGASQMCRAMTDPAVQGGAFCQRIEAPERIYRWLEWGNAWRVRRRGLPYGDQGIFVRRSTFDKVGAFPEVAFMEDLLFMRRFRRLATPVLLPGPLHVSARRWQRHGVLRQTARNWLLVGANSLGVSPDRLARFYAARK